MLCLIIVVLGSTACSTPSKAPDRDLTPTTPETPTEPEETVFPPVTSKDTELYISRNADDALFVVNPYGTIGTEYMVDEAGNIALREGKIVVSHENA